MKEITNTYTLNMQPTVDILNNDESKYFSGLFLDTLREYLTHDCLDAMREVEILHAILKKRCDDILGGV